MKILQLIDKKEFDRVLDSDADRCAMLSLVADMCRLNTLVMVKKAGSGHLGTSFSAMDIVVWLYCQHMNTVHEGFDAKDRDIFFSSKGHDVPGLYALFYALGILPEEKILKLRRIDGLDGHPHVSIPGCEINSGSLGMGISKGRGIAWAKKMRGDAGAVYVMTGDGELQEGQIYEALRNAANHKIDMTVIVDHNKVQSDKQVANIADLGNLEKIFADFGWRVFRCDGHDFGQLEAVLDACKEIHDCPKIIIADTIKGRGISFMEHPQALEDAGGIYRWHSGAPDDISFQKGFSELYECIMKKTQVLGISPIRLKTIDEDEKSPSGVTREFVKDAYGKTVCMLAYEYDDIVVLDADLADDCRVREFEKTFPHRFIECGIAEQDMVSTAGGFALQGYLPFVNSFSSFLSSRANEQIYANATEGTRIIYACHYAGLIPAGPGLSHQSVRDISLFCALPNCVIVQPANAQEMEAAVNYAVKTCCCNCMLRIAIGPSPRTIVFPSEYEFTEGRGTVLTTGDDAAIFAYGPVMVHEALTAAEYARENGVRIRVINMPWLNRCDREWLQEVISDISSLYVLEDHSVRGGLGEFLLHHMTRDGIAHMHTLTVYGLEEYPAWGSPAEVLEHHQLSGACIAQKILGSIG